MGKGSKSSVNGRCSSAREEEVNLSLSRLSWMTFRLLLLLLFVFKGGELRIAINCVRNELELFAFLSAVTAVSLPSSSSSDELSSNKSAVSFSAREWARVSLSRG